MFLKLKSENNTIVRVNVDNILSYSRIEPSEFTILVMKNTQNFWMVRESPEEIDKKLFNAEIRVS